MGSELLPVIIVIKCRGSEFGHRLHFYDFNDLLDFYDFYVRIFDFINLTIFINMIIYEMDSNLWRLTLILVVLSLTSKSFSLSVSFGLISFAIAGSRLSMGGICAVSFQLVVMLSVIFSIIRQLSSHFSTFIFSFKNRSI